MNSFIFKETFKPLTRADSPLTKVNSSPKFTIFSVSVDGILGICEGICVLLQPYKKTLRIIATMNVNIKILWFIIKQSNHLLYREF